MYKAFLFLILIFCSCAVKGQNEVLVDSIKVVILDFSFRTEPYTIDNSGNPGDTLFIQRKFTKDYYHAIYIDTSRNSKYYDWLTDFEFDHYDSLSINESYKYIREKPSVVFQKVNTSSLSKNWVPVYEYKNQFYLYAPSDWGNAGRRLINDSAFVYWYMDGPMLYPMKSLKKLDNGDHQIEIIEPYDEISSSSKLTIHPIDPNTGLSVFEFGNEVDEYKYQLYVPAENARQFDMIVNFCESGKQREFHFDKIDFEKLIKMSQKD